MISKALAVINPERCCVVKGASGSLASLLERTKEPSMLLCIGMPAGNAPHDAHQRENLNPSKHDKIDFNI